MKPFKVRTPGSYSLDSKTTPPRKKVGRPGSAKKQKKARQVKHREKYDEQDMLEAVRLVREEGYSKLKAASHINGVKRNAVPRMTLSDRLHSDQPARKPALGRPQEKAHIFSPNLLLGT
jgi:transposase-like protein